MSQDREETGPRPDGGSMSGGNVADLLIWRCARETVRRYGVNAPMSARHKAQAASFDGDADGARIWYAVEAACDRIVKCSRHDEYAVRARGTARSFPLP